MARRRAAAAVASNLGRALLGAALSFGMCPPRRAVADGGGTSIRDEEILDKKDDGLKIVSVGTQVAAFDQWGFGYQSKDGPVRGPDGIEHVEGAARRSSMQWAGQCANGANNCRGKIRSGRGDDPGGEG